MDLNKIKKLMQDMENIPAERVIIEGPQRIIIEEPKVMKINMMGQETFQIVGESRIEEQEVEISEDDVELISKQIGKDAETVREKLKENKGDIAKTILDLKD